MSRFPGYYDTGDSGIIDSDGYVHILARTDDVINVAGHRLSTGAMEEVLVDHHDVAEVAVVGMRDNFKGQLPLGLLVLNSSCKRPHNEIEKEVIAMVRERIGPVASFKNACVVQRLPKTRSGKILRGVIRQIANGDENIKVPATIEDPEALAEIQQVIRKHEKWNVT